MKKSFVKMVISKLLSTIRRYIVLFFSIKSKALALSSILFVTACAEIPNLNVIPQNIISLQTNVVKQGQKNLLPDLPVPPKSKIIADRSLILGRAEKWTGRVIVSSDDVVEKVFLFFQQRMPSAGWEEVTSLQGETATLIFSKGERVANIIVRPTSSTFSSTSESEITVSPNRRRETGLLQ